MSEQGTIMIRIVLLIVTALMLASCQSEREARRQWIDQCIQNELTPKQCAFLYVQLVHWGAGK
jgi:hypothetical protein